MDDYQERLARLEAYEQIRQLAARYALALDSRNVTDLVGLFAPDVHTGDGGMGRDALARWFDPILRPYGITFHHVGGHVITITGGDTADGTVYCRAEHEVGDEWIVMPVIYHDRYVRDAEDGRWYFRSRKPKPLYAAEVNQNPLQIPGRFHFPGNPYITAVDLPEGWSSWREFWARESVGDTVTDAHNVVAQEGSA